MSNIEEYTNKLRNLGFSDEEIKRIIILYISSGDNETLEYYLSSKGIKNNSEKA